MFLWKFHTWKFTVVCIFICSVAIQVTKSIDTLQDSKINSRDQTNSVSIPSSKKNSKSIKKIVRKLSLSDDDDESLLGLVPEEKLQEDLNDDIIPSSPPHKKVNFIILSYIFVLENSVKRQLFLIAENV